mmetsp:Transcript_16439/g.50380  ORF Transcript_16439/g.50380 Transcript_16439/m.50380 type:complete len:207 (-) Transcript_16439:784-1404(-)
MWDLVAVQELAHHLHRGRVEGRVCEGHHVSRHGDLVHHAAVRGRVDAHDGHAREGNHGPVVVKCHGTHAAPEAALRDNGVAARVDVIEVHGPVDAAVQQPPPRKADVVDALELTERAERCHVRQREHPGVPAGLRGDDEAGEGGVPTRVGRVGHGRLRGHGDGEGDGQAMLVLHGHDHLRDERKVVEHVVERHLPVTPGEGEDLPG